MRMYFFQYIIAIAIVMLASERLLGAAQCPSGSKNKIKSECQDGTYKKARDLVSDIIRISDRVEVLSKLNFLSHAIVEATTASVVIAEVLTHWMKLFLQLNLREPIQRFPKHVDVRQ